MTLPVADLSWSLSVSSGIDDIELLLGMEFRRFDGGVLSDKVGNGIDI